MPTPPTLVQYGTGQSTGSLGGTATPTTPSLSWQTNDVVIVLVAAEGGTNGDTINTPTTGGSGLSFASQKLHAASSDCPAGCWAAVASGNSSGTVQAVCTNGNGSLAITGVIGVYVFRGSAGIGNSALGTGSGRTVDLTPIGADGSIAWVVADWNAAAVEAFTPSATSHSSGSPGPSASPTTGTVTGRFTFYIADLDDQASGGQTAYGIGGTAAGPFTIIAVEAKAAGGGPADSGPNYAGAASDLGGGSGSWVNPTNADGAPDATYATWSP